jgi:TetR/AcrR family transcriptional regulator
MKTKPETASTEERILEAAKKIFIAHGFDGAKTQDIATAAGVNKALLHYYFKNKETLFSAVFDYVSNDYAPRMLAIAQSELPFKEKIESIIDGYMDFYNHHAPELLFLLNEMNKNPERFVKSLSNTQNFAKLAEFSQYLQKEMLLGTIKTMHPIHFIINIVSLCAFPPLSGLMMRTISGISEEQFKVFLEQRRSIVKQLILDSVLV